MRTPTADIGHSTDTSRISAVAIRHMPRRHRTPGDARLAGRRWSHPATVTALLLVTNGFMAAPASAAVAASAVVPVDSGTVVGWGGDGAGETSGPTGLTDVRAVSLGAAHSLVLKNDGTVSAWGWNRWGEAAVPEGLNNVKAISAGNWHNLALKNDGTVVAWGYNEWGQATVPQGLNNVVAIAAGHSHNLALKADGTVVAWGVPGVGTTPVGLTGVKAIAAGVWHNLVVKNDGTVYTWGLDAFGLMNVPASATNVVAVSGGNYHSLALRADGTVVAWGYNVDGETDVPAGLTGVKAIEAGYFHNLAVKNDGTVVGWGYSAFGQTTVPATVHNAIALAAGNHQSLAVVGKAAPADTTAPVLNLPGDLAATATSGSGATVRYTVTATDNADPNPQVSCTGATGTIYPTGTDVTAAFPAGSTQLTCTARDQAGNTSTGRFTVNVNYGWAGIRPPIDPNGTSVFKTGSTVPVKFALGGASAGVTDLRATLSYASSTKGPWTAAKTRTGVVPGDQFRYDAGQYVFNWSTSGLTPGVYQLRIDLGDGTPRTVQVTLKA